MWGSGGERRFPGPGAVASRVSENPPKISNDVLGRRRSREYLPMDFCDDKVPEELPPLLARHAAGTLSSTRFMRLSTETE